MRAFGGQVAAQALVAAGATVDAEDRDVHSLHAYFLRPGRTTDHIIYAVERLRDGRSFTTRRVRAIQYGETIFAMSASFAPPQQGPAHQRSNGQAKWWTQLPAAEDLPPERVFDHITVAAQAEENELPDVLAEHGYPTRQRFDMRVIRPEDAYDLTAGVYDRLVWVRSSQQIPNDQQVNVCVLTYFSDLNMAGTVMGAHGGRLRTQNLDIASLDHAMWFHNPFRASEWMLFATESPASVHGRGLTRGVFYRGDGILAASTTQEVLIRQPFRRQ
jgi:acyl-CoA thioesterase-2